jgi:hypothetical protein
MTSIETKGKTYTMAQLRQSKRSLFVRNNTGLLWTLHEKVGNGQKIDIELRPSGQAESITYLPPTALDAPGIARNIALGKITVSPDLEDEMIELMSGGAASSKKLLDQFQVELQESPHARAIDVKGKVQDRLDQAIRKRAVTPQGQQGVTGSLVDEFINPSPIKADDGTLRDGMTGEVMTPVADVEATEDVSQMLSKVVLTQSQRVRES